jgi:hypothetical protein
VNGFNKHPDRRQFSDLTGHVEKHLFEAWKIVYKRQKQTCDYSHIVKNLLVLRDITTYIGALSKYYSEIPPIRNRLEDLQLRQTRCQEDRSAAARVQKPEKKSNEDGLLWAVLAFILSYFVVGYLSIEISEFRSRFIFYQSIFTFFLWPIYPGIPAAWDWL